MNQPRQIFLWMYLLNKRILKQALFLILIALVPILVFGVGQLSRESSSLVTAAVAPRSADDEASQQLIRSLVDGSTSAVRYIACKDEEELLHAVTTGQARIGFLLPPDLNALFQAYGSQKTKNLSAGALVLLGSLLGSDNASQEMKEHAIQCFAATNDVVSKLTREQLFGKMYPSLEKAVLKTWLKIHPEVGSMDNAQREQFVDETIAAYETDYDFFDLEYLDGTPVKEDEIDRYIASPMRGLLAVLLTLTGFAAILYLAQDCQEERFVWIPAHLHPIFHYLYLLIPLIDVALAVFVALFLGGSFTRISVELPALLLLVLQVAGFSNLLRILLRRKDFMASSIPILICACLFLTPVFVDLSILEPLQMLLPPYLYLKTIHGNLPIWYMAIYAAITGICSMLIDRT
ncbi:MAG TPA: hypothetical protein DHV42_04130 [Lachnospiraceae bacterium]|nr:hypothetical protein [Lachnospiraceae bacterium]